MKKLVIKLATIALLSLFSVHTYSAPNEAKIGKAIYKKAMGIGCYGCHAASSNPQIIELIKDGSLKLPAFSKTVTKGKGGMPAMVSAIMGIKVKDGGKKKTIAEWGVSEAGALKAIFNYLKSK